jgi:uncharacterized phage infection (PIP) family protein YhgE
MAVSANKMVGKASKTATKSVDNIASSVNKVVGKTGKSVVKGLDNLATSTTKALGNGIDNLRNSMNRLTGQMNPALAGIGGMDDVGKTADKLEDWYSTFKKSIMKSDSGGSGVRISGAVDEKAIGKVADSAADARKVGVVDDVVERAANTTNLLDDLANGGVKYNPKDVVAVTKTADGKLVWLENGSDTAGLNHIIKEHGTDFANRGISQADIPNYITQALSEGKIVGYQGRGIGRPIYEFTYNGITQRVAITVGSNGFVVGANPVSIK